jgi:glycosyltransferase involved in cell wall biosynthesis
MSDLSVVIPAWGPHVAYVPRALESLVSQAGPELEIIVVDNVSEPPVSGLPDFVRVIRPPERLAIGAVRNFGLRSAGAPYVMFWDADDVLLPGALGRMWSVLEADPGLVAATMDSVRWTPETGPGEPWPWPRAAMYRLCRRRWLFAVIAQVLNPFTTTGPAVMRTSVVRDAGGFPEDIAFFEDWALSGSLAVRGRIAMLRETARLYRVHDDSLSLGHLDHPDQGQWLAGMRRRTWRDPRVPLWLKALLPGIRVAHLARERRRRSSGVGGGYYEAALKRVGGERKG